ncbi:hypothetical protein M977_03599 [Buttiauxella gaviniae ATCC 51604]|uniref:tRNA_anti-like n=1 Tax=Buttiauxella gaviniae ATCC 51604 TaxID=1354253 RepID=A0A1B7HSN1_9ENTR|nr:hypothetical protein [Buttiauxella gaviniae]OAT18677.1 hypothetical protein M977_03599 [Buttiauxella gaviniae ATCC 51604]
MNKHTDNVSYNKLLKGTGIFIVLFIAMCWVLTKTEERDQQVKSQQSVEAPVEAVPAPPVEDSVPEAAVYRYTPKELLEAFDANELRITHKLNGNILALRGKISDIGLSLGKPVIGISIPDTSKTIRVFFDSDMVDLVSRLNVGDYVLVGSPDVSLNPFGTIHLRNASLLNDTASN